MEYMELQRKFIEIVLKNYSGRIYGKLLLFSGSSVSARGGGIELFLNLVQPLEGI